MFPNSRFFRLFWYNCRKALAKSQDILVNLPIRDQSLRKLLEQELNKTNLSKANTPLPIGNIAAILLAAGSGERFGGNTPKQFLPLAGKPLFLHALEKLERSCFFKEICVIVPKDWLEWTRAQVNPPTNVVEGGATRQESSRKGLESLSKTSKLVLIHDAARPFLSQKLIQESLEAGWLHGAADACIPSNDTLVFSKKGDFLESIPPRSHFLRGQTPQVFHYQKILAAHAHARELKIENATDDCRLVLEMGDQVAIVRGDEMNLKITSELDLRLAELLLSQPQNSRMEALQEPPHETH